MKYVIVILVVLAVIWFVRNVGSQRRSDASAAPPPPQRPPEQAQDMVQCPVCGVHLPRGEALPGPDGRLYCCAEHRLRSGA